MNYQYFECGCAMRDEESSDFYTRVVFRRCKKHQQEMKSCSWVAWAKKFAPVQYASYQKDIGRNRKEDL